MLIRGCGRTDFQVRIYLLFYFFLVVTHALLFSCLGFDWICDRRPNEYSYIRTYIPICIQYTYTRTHVHKIIRDCNHRSLFPAFFVQKIAQGGNSTKLYNSVHKKLFCLPDNCLVFPAHDYKGLTSSTIKEEKEFNSRLNKVRYGILAFSSFYYFVDIFIYVFFLFFQVFLLVPRFPLLHRNWNFYS